MKTATCFAVVLLAVIALVHLLRLVFGWEVIIAGWTAPVWLSAIGLAVPGALAFLIYREHRG